MLTCACVGYSAHTSQDPFATGCATHTPGSTIPCQAIPSSPHMSEAPDDLSPGPGPSPGRPEHVPSVLPTSPNSDYPFFSRFPLAADTATMAMSRSRSDGAAGRPPPKLTLTEVDSGRPYPLAEGGDRPSSLAEGCGSGGRSSFDPASRGHSPDARPESAIPFRGPPAMWGPPVREKNRSPGYILCATTTCLQFGAITV